MTRAVRRSTFEEIYNDTGDAEAHGIATLLTKNNTVACFYMLLYVVAKVQGRLIWPVFLGWLKAPLHG